MKLPIETERLVIRPFAPDADLDAMARIYGDPDVMRWILGGTQTRDEVRATLVQQLERQDERGFAFWAVVERETGALIGDVGFGVFEETGDVEIGWTLARDRWGRDYATEAARACLGAARVLRAPRIVAVVDEENLASQAVARRIGMRQVDALVVDGRAHAIFAQS